MTLRGKFVAKVECGNFRSYRRSFTASSYIQCALEYRQPMSSAPQTFHQQRSEQYTSKFLLAQRIKGVAIGLALGYLLGSSLLWGHVSTNPYGDLFLFFLTLFGFIALVSMVTAIWVYRLDIKFG